MNSEIKSSDHLLQSDILALINKEILALRIYPASSTTDCERWNHELETKQVMNRYSNATDMPVTRIGMTLFETENRPDKIELYLRKGQSTKHQVKEIFGCHNPLDHLINLLCTSWSLGCEIQQYARQPMNPGIIRSFEACAFGGLPPHIDSLLKDIPNHDEFVHLKSQLAANLYFSVSEEGGELEIWNFEPDAIQLKGLFSGDYDFIDRTKIPVSSTCIKPRIGELILFRSNCVHSVRSHKKGARSAASCFIGYYNTERPLTIWS